MSPYKSMTDVTSHMNGIQERAGYFAELAVPGRNKDKRLAGLLDCSPNMAYRLRKGEGWTAERLALAARRFGWRWVQAVFGPIAGQGGNEDVFSHEIEALRARLDAISCSLRGVEDHDMADRKPVLGNRDAARDGRREARSSEDKEAAE